MPGGSISQQEQNKQERDIVIVFCGGFLSTSGGSPYEGEVPKGCKLLGVTPSSVCSIHDRVMQIFYEIKGGKCLFAIDSDIDIGIDIDIVCIEYIDYLTMCIYILYFFFFFTFTNFLFLLLQLLLLLRLLLTGTVNYGKEHSNFHNHNQYGDTYPTGIYEEWDENHPIHFIGHSFGGITIRALLAYLEQGKCSVV